MTNHAEVQYRSGDYNDTELRAVVATLAGLEPDQVCEVAVTLIFHPAPGLHEMRVLVDNQAGAGHVAGLLRHVAAHVHGGCKPCRDRNRKAGRRV